MKKPCAKREKKKGVRAASDKLYYDIWMLLSSAAEMSSGKTKPGIINNALLESFLIHARVMLDFLYSKKEKVGLHPDDIIADDFFADPKSWGKHREPKTALLKTVPKVVLV